MKRVNLLENIQFRDKDPIALPLHSDRQGRAILFTLKPGQFIREHNAPSSPFFAVVLQGEGIFSGGDSIEHTCGPNSLLVFDMAEPHFIRATTELVFLGYLHGVKPPGTRDEVE